jgi:hypothetical protein
LRSYALAGFSASELPQALTLALKDAAAGGGVYAIILDGTADFVTDVNDQTECNAFVAELHAMAIDHDCPIINVVHENPGQDGGKMRGHLGSQLERKGESNLRLQKTHEVTVLFSEKQRGAPILEKDGPRFAWSNEAGMHVTVEAAGAVRDAAKRDRLSDIAEAVFGHREKRLRDAMIPLTPRPLPKEREPLPLCAGCADAHRSASERRAPCSLRHFAPPSRLPSIR